MKNPDELPEARIVRVTFGDDAMVRATLQDGREIGTPLAWYPRLLGATQGQRENYQILGRGGGVYWPDVDEDLSVAGMLRGERGRWWVRL